jgi:molybdopterin-guanine dinucleotide biosynthesis protein A
MTADPDAIIAVILAGGAARRLGGGDKCLRLLGGRPILDHVIERLAGQAADIVLNANGDRDRFAAWSLPVLADGLPGRPGPLAGVLSALEWVRDRRGGGGVVVSVPGDGPFLPRDLVARLVAARAAAGADLAVARSRGRLNPVVALWPVSIAEALRRALTLEGAGRVEDFVRRHRFATANFDDFPVDPLFNVNTAEDLAAAERMLAHGRLFEGAAEMEAPGQ